MLFQSLLYWSFFGSFEPSGVLVMYIGMFVMRLIIVQKTLSALKISMSKKSWCKSGRLNKPERHFSYLSQRPRYLLTSNLLIEIVNEHSKMQFLKSGGIRRRKSGFTTQCGNLMTFLFSQILREINFINEWMSLKIFLTWFHVKSQ